MRWAIEDFDPGWPEFVADPYPFYARLLSEDPVHFVGASNSWWVTKHADATRVLSSREFGNEKPHGARQVYPEVMLLEELGIPCHIVLRDPPDHTRLRTIVGKAFTVGVVENLKPRIFRIAEELLAKVEPRGRMDLVADFAFPLPAIVIAELLGVPPEDRERFSAWSTRYAMATDATQPEDFVRSSARDLRDLVDYFRDLVEKRRLERRDDLISALISVEDGGQRLSPGELLSMCILLLNAGHETSKNLIATGALALLLDRPQLDLLRDRPSLISTAVEELLRYVSPGQRMPRHALEDVEIRGKRVAKGEVVEVVIGAANRDPEVFSNPDRLDITRKANPHIAFGRGIHLCLGAPLARAEGAIGFRLLLEKFPDITLAARPEWSHNTRIRGLTSLVVAF